MLSCVGVDDGCGLCQVEAERKKRANILDSEGEVCIFYGMSHTFMYGCVCVCVGARESAINRAEGLRQSKILASEAMRIEQVNMAKGECTHTTHTHAHAACLCVDV